MNLKTKLLLIIVLLVNIQLFAQDTFNVSGTVKDESDVPIPGANVVVLNTTRGVQTDFDGNYTIAVSAGEVIQFSYIGYGTQTRIIDEAKQINIVLLEIASKLDEVVLIGYGEQSKKKVTSALTKIGGEEIQDFAVSRVESALQGKVAGLRIQTVASEAGGDPQITLRGPGSITGNSAPLIVVDGVVLGNDADLLGTIDNNNIASISVLKDASSVAIYGSRGANGVILVTLKEGVVGKTSFSFNTYTGTKYANKNDNFNPTIASERARLISLEDEVNAITNPENAARINNNYDVAFAELEALDFIASLGDGEQNWQDEIFPGGTITNYSFTARGGTELTKYTASLSYLQDEGIALIDEFKRYNARVKIDSKSKNKKLRYGSSLRATLVDQDRLPARFTDPLRQYGHIPLRLNEDHLNYVTNFSRAIGTPTDAGAQFENLGVGSFGFSRAFDHVFTQDPNNRRAILRDPATGLPIPSQLTSGGLTLSTTRNVHPLVHFLERSRERIQLNFNASAYLEYKLAKGLKYKQTIAGFFRHSRINNQDNVLGQENRDQEAFRLERKDERFQFVTESLLTYKGSTGKHNFNPILGFEYTFNDYRRQEAEAVGFTNDFNENIALADGGTIFTQNGEEKLVSYFGRLNYDYDGKYLLSLSARADGSTRFGPNRRFGFFPAASVGWNISSEKFLENSDVISFLKLRASYGVSGSNTISNNIFDSLFRFEETFATVGFDNEVGVKNITLANPDLGWEQLIEFNPGIDVTFGRGLIGLSLDYYTRTSNDLILFAPIAAVNGADAFLENIGEVKNEGVEIALTSRIISSEDFRWNVGGQFSLNRNTVQDLGGNDQIISRIDQDTRPTEFIARVGQPITSFFGFVFDREIPLEYVDNPFNRFNNDFADVFVKDLNNDGIIDDEDRTELGSPYPDFEWGFNTDLLYKNFDLSMQWSGSHGAEVRVADLDQLLFASESNVNEVANFPGADLTVHRRFTDDHIQDASFVALRNATLGYNFPTRVIEKLNIDNLRVYLTGENLLFFFAEGYQGFNPEAVGQTSNNANTPLTFGYQRGDGPLVRSVTLGFNFNF